MILSLSALALVLQVAVNTATTPAPAGSPLEIVIYSDFQCPYCRQFAAATHDMRSSGLGGVPIAITFKHFPLPFHKNASLAAAAAEAAKRQGKFWEMHDLLFANQPRLQRRDLLGYAGTLGLDLVRFESDLDSDATQQVIARDVVDGTKAGITATPTYLINGKLYEGTRTVQQLAALTFGNGTVSGSASRRAAAPAVPSDITEAMLAFGPAGAPITIELFADLQSPITAAALQVVDDVQHRYPAAVRVQFRNYPLTFHPQAMATHEAAMAAARTGTFWEFTRALLALQQPVHEQDIVAVAQTIGLNGSQLRQSMAQHQYRSRVDADLQEAVKRGVRGSPALLVNGQRMDGVPSVQALAAAVSAALTDTGASATARK